MVYKKLFYSGSFFNILVLFKFFRSTSYCSIIVLYYFILYITSNYSALCCSSDCTLWGGPATRFKPGTGGLEALTLTSRPPHPLDQI